jgi:phage terminase small subunit
MAKGPSHRAHPRLYRFQAPVIEIYRRGTTPEAPGTLGEHGAKLWRDILTEFDVTDRARLTILEQACACYERAESLRAQIAISGEEIETGIGSTKANPLIALELQARSLCARLIGKLHLSDEPKRLGRPPNAGAGRW